MHYTSKKILMKQNVFDAARERIKWVFSEFETVVVNVSGGKDSTVVFNLALDVARELKRLPLRVMSYDFEAEWQGAVEQLEHIMTHKDVLPMWYQTPFVLKSSHTYAADKFIPWDLAKKKLWMREKHPLARTAPLDSTDDRDMFQALMEYNFKGKKACYLGGVRCEESPNRFMGLTARAVYKGRTWGRKLGTDQYSFYPIYDWTYSDVWKAIHDNKWRYCKIYDSMYQHGHDILNMRISPLNHEMSIKALFLLQELEPDTYSKLCWRMPGVSTITHFGKDDFYCPDKLPPMFEDWRD